MVKRVLTPLVPLLVIALLGGCSSSPSAEVTNQPAPGDAGDTVIVVITRDFGKELVLERNVEIDADTSAMAALQMVADVGTKYGGGYVESINGISPESRKVDKDRAWFFYVNGIASNLGARDCILRDGDVEHWDFRDWSYQQFVPAIIGDFPRPFLSDERPTIVVYEPAYAAGSETLAAAMRGYGVAEVSAVSDDLLSDEARQNSNLLIIAGQDNPLVSELNKNYKKFGFFAYFDSEGLTVLDAEGNTSLKLGEGSGVIQATQNPWNPAGVGAGENVVWMVTGFDDDGVRSTVAALLENQDGLRYAFAVIVNQGQVVKIP